jgi:hypothetical protein
MGRHRAEDAADNGRVMEEALAEPLPGMVAKGHKKGQDPLRSAIRIERELPGGPVIELRHHSSYEREFVEDAGLGHDVLGDLLGIVLGVAGDEIMNPETAIRPQINATYANITNGCLLSAIHPPSDTKAAPRAADKPLSSLAFICGYCSF